MTALLLTMTGASTAIGATELDLLPLGDPERAHALGAAAPGMFLDTRRAEALELEAMATALADARVVLVGEEHTSMDQKLFHEQLLRALAERRPGLVLGMEFFLRSDRDALARWSRGEIDDDGLLDEVGWYDRGGYRFEYYAPVMHAARELGVPVVGLNVPREIPRTVNRQGLAGLDESQRAEVGDVEVGGSPQHRYLISRYFGETVALLPSSWFENMYSAQCLWDVVMARSILAELPADGAMMVIVGAGHVAYDLGISRRLADERRAAGQPPLEVATFCPVTAPPPDDGDEPAGHPMGGHGGAAGVSPAQFVRSLADWVGAFEDRGSIEAFPTLGLKIADDGEGPATVEMTWPDTFADGAGFEAGDVVLDVNGRPVANATELRRRLARLQWGDRADLLVRRGDLVIAIPMLLFPDPETVETTVAPGWDVQPVGEVDPESSGRVATVEIDPTPLRRRLVSSPGKPTWVGEWRGDRLDVVHVLDEAGRTARTVYRLARPDRTVEILWDRDAAGETIGFTRLDRSETIISAASSM